jgi:hypothetical protein
MLRPARIPKAFRLFALLPLVAVAVCGCLGEPEVEERWTILDIESSNLSHGQALQAGASESISVRAAITYRRIVTGFAVAELRASSTVPAGGVTLHPDAPRVAMAQDIDNILANSVSLGRSVRAITGWDHLIQPIHFVFRATPSATIDSAGVPVGATTGLFLLCYLGSGEEFELPGGADSIVVTPFPSTPNEILPVGMELQVTP